MAGERGSPQGPPNQGCGIKRGPSSARPSSEEISGDAVLATSSLAAGVGGDSLAHAVAKAAENEKESANGVIHLNFLVMIFLKEEASGAITKYARSSEPR